MTEIQKNILTIIGCVGVVALAMWWVFGEYDISPPPVEIHTVVVRQNLAHVRRGYVSRQVVGVLFNACGDSIAMADSVADGKLITTFTIIEGDD